MTVDTFNATTTWLCPTGVTVVDVLCIGGGGAGGGNGTGAATDRSAGGGAGGTSARKATFAVTPGNTYTVTVGAAKTGTSTSLSAANTGNITWFSVNSTLGVVANGGVGGNPRTTNSGSAAGVTAVTTGSFGDTLFKGGNGSAGTTGFGIQGGGGGGAAGLTAVGGNATAGVSSTTPGTGNSPGGNGGAGATGDAAGNAGNAPGAGGGGANIANSGTAGHAGGQGAAGQIVLTYTGPASDNVGLTVNYAAISRASRW